MRTLFVVVILVLVSAAQSVAQTPTVSFTASDNAASAAAAQAFEHRIYVDQSAGVLVPGITCTGTQPSISCTGPLPSVVLPFLATAGRHEITITAQATGTAESPRSAPFLRPVSATAPKALTVTPPVP